MSIANSERRRSDLVRRLPAVIRFPRDNCLGTRPNMFTLPRARRALRRRRPLRVVRVKRELHGARQGRGCARTARSPIVTGPWPPPQVLLLGSMAVPAATTCGHRLPRRRSPAACPNATTIEAESRGYGPLPARAIVGLPTWRRGRCQGRDASVASVLRERPDELRGGQDPWTHEGGRSEQHHGIAFPNIRLTFMPKCGQGRGPVAALGTLG